MPKVTVIFCEPKGKLALEHWPGRLDATIPEAIRWFRKKFGKPPTIIQVTTLDKKVRQDICMYAPGIRPY